MTVPDKQRGTVPLKLRVSAEARRAIEALATLYGEPMSRVVERLALSPVATRAIARSLIEK